MSCDSDRLDGIFDVGRRLDTVARRACGVALHDLRAHSYEQTACVVGRTYVFDKACENSLDGLLMVDGDVKQEVSDDTAVIVKKADLTVNFIKARHHDFYERLVSKLAHWATPADDLHNDVE